MSTYIYEDRGIGGEKSTFSTLRRTFRGNFQSRIILSPPLENPRGNEDKHFLLMLLIFDLTTLADTIFIGSKNFCHRPNTREIHERTSAWKRKKKKEGERDFLIKENV